MISIIRFQVHTGKETLVLVFKKKNQSEMSNEVKISRKSGRLEFTTWEKKTFFNKTQVRFSIQVPKMCIFRNQILQIYPQDVLHKELFKFTFQEIHYNEIYKKKMSI